MKKTTSQKITKRLAQYGALSAAIVGVADASGQVGGPTVVNDDILATQYELDMDGDTVIDFRFVNNNSSILVASAFANNAEILGSSSIYNGNTYYLPYALDSSAAISNNAVGNWFNDSFQTMNYGSCLYGNWCSAGGGVTKFLGLRFYIGSDIHYGWAKFSVEKNPKNGATLIEYYYNPNIDQPTFAGKTQTLDISENVFSEVKIVALNKTIALFNLPEKTNYKLYNISGQKILNGEINNRIHSIEANSVSTGIYIIILEDPNSNAVIRKKIML